jgi:divalent metal cation (Fe/Co/Zn/Cd) transporter
MDQAVEAEVREQIDTTLEAFRHHQTVRFDHVTTRRAGPRRFVDMHLHMPGSWSLSHAAAVRGEVERSLMAAVPGLRATIQLLPMDVEAHVDDPRDAE